MAVFKAKPEKLVQYALALMEKQAILPYFTTRVASGDFVGAKGDTVTFRPSGADGLNYQVLGGARDYEFRTRTAPIVLDDIAPFGGAFPIKLNVHSYTATALTDEQLTLDEIDFANEVVGPQVTAVSDRLEAKGITAFRAAHPKHTLTVSVDDDIADVTGEAKRLMDLDKVTPASGRVFVLGTNIAALWANSDRLLRYDSTGLAGTPALRDSIIGRLAGSPVVEHNGLDPNEAYYVHSSGILLANVSPAVPRGVTLGSQRTSAKGFAMRWIMDYDPNYLRDRSVVSAFFGSGEVRDERDWTNGMPGGWIYEEGDFQDEDDWPVGIDPRPIADGGDLHPTGTRKNVRIMPIVTSDIGSGSLLS